MWCPRPWRWCRRSARAAGARVCSTHATGSGGRASAAVDDWGALPGRRRGRRPSEAVAAGVHVGAASRRRRGAQSQWTRDGVDSLPAQRVDVTTTLVGLAHRARRSRGWRPVRAGRTRAATHPASTRRVTSPRSSARSGTASTRREQTSHEDTDRQPMAAPLLDRMDNSRRNAPGLAPRATCAARLNETYRSGCDRAMLERDLAKRPEKTCKRQHTRRFTRVVRDDRPVCT
jgi:hypothetical protein